MRRHCPHYDPVFVTAGSTASATVTCCMCGAKGRETSQIERRPLAGHGPYVTVDQRVASPIEWDKPACDVMLVESMAPT